MKDNGEQPRPGMPRMALPHSVQTVDAVFWIAFGVSTLFVVAQIAFAGAFVPVMLYAYDTAGLQLPPILAAADRLGPLGIPLALGLADAIVFALFVWGARRHWLGLLFVPPLLYLLAAFVLFASGISGAAVVFLR